MYPGLSEYSKEMHLLNLPNISMKRDMASSDAYYAVLHMHDLKEGSRTEQELEPCPGITIQKNAFFSEIWYMRITGRRKLP